MVKPPCKDCKDRKVGCHSVCEKYINFQKEHEKEMKEIRKEKDSISLWYDVHKSKYKR